MHFEFVDRGELCDMLHKFQMNLIGTALDNNGYGVGCRICFQVQPLLILTQLQAP